jgi:hypothetical protein
MDGRPGCRLAHLLVGRRGDWRHHLKGVAVTYWSHLLGHRYPCNVSTCPVVTGRPATEETNGCATCRLTHETPEPHADHN